MNNPLIKTGKIFGYHGTHSSNVKEIINNGFAATVRKDHWLGQGIYFYDNQELSKWWIETKNKSKLNCAIIETTIIFEGNNTLNLDEVAGLDFFFKEGKTLLDGLGIKIEFKEKEYYRNICLLLDLLKKKHTIKIVIATFSKKSPKYADSNVHGFEKSYFKLPHGISYKERQICISDNSVITNKVCVYYNEPKIPNNWKDL